MARRRELSPAVQRQRQGVGQKTPKLEADGPRAFDPSAVTRMFEGGTKPGPGTDPTRKPKRQDRRWQKIQAAQLGREPFCRECAKTGKRVQAEQVDHITPLADGGPFDDPRNLQSLCLDCHTQKTHQENVIRRTGKPPRRPARRPVRIRGCDPLTGLPLDPNHWWNQDK